MGLRETSNGFLGAPAPFLLVFSPRSTWRDRPRSGIFCCVHNLCSFAGHIMAIVYMMFLNMDTPQSYHWHAFLVILIQSNHDFSTVFRVKCKRLVYFILHASVSCLCIVNDAKEPGSP